MTIQRAPAPDICAAVIAHDEGPILCPTLASVDIATCFARSRGLSVETIIVLDRPDSLTAEIAKSFADRLENCRIIPADNGDLGESRNFAAAQTDAIWIGFLDGDDLWCEDWLYRAYTLGTADARLLALHPAVSLYFGLGPVEFFAHVDMEAPNFDIANLLIENFWTALSFAKSETYRRIPYSRNDIRHGIGYEDWSWNCNVIAQGGIHKVVPQTVHFVRRKRRSMLVDSNARETLPSPHNLMQYILARR